MFEFFTNHIEYFLIPLISALVGWGTNWVAIQMTFYPLEPIGKPPYFGWVGIIPSKTEKMGRIATRSVLAKLGTLGEIFEAMEPEKLAKHVAREFEPRVEEFVDSFMLDDNPAVWEMTPVRMKTIIYQMVRRKLPETITKITEDVRENIEEMLDLEWTVVRELKKDKALTNRIFLEVGAREFKFIISLGFYFGFLLGVVQAIVWFLVQYYWGGSDGQVAAWWLLPLFSAIVGYATNALALRVIFKPVNPIKIGFFSIQGLFLKRQDEVAEVWSEIVTKEILTIRNIIDSMLHGPKSARAQAVIRRHVRHTTDQVLGPTKILAQGALGARKFSELKDHSADAAIDFGLEAFEDPVFIASRAEIVKRMMVERMQGLSSKEFQVLLRPAFEEDEFKLMLLGGILGGVAGLLQVLLLF